MMYAAKLGVPIAAIEVEVQADYDDGALFGVSDSPPGYLDVRYTVTVESAAPAADIERVVDEGDAHSPYLDVFSRAQTCRRSLRIVSPREAADPRTAAFDDAASGSRRGCRVLGLHPRAAARDSALRRTRVPRRTQPPPTRLRVGTASTRRGCRVGTRLHPRAAAFRTRPPPQRAAASTDLHHARRVG